MLVIIKMNLWNEVIKNLKTTTFSCCNNNNFNCIL